MGLSSGFVRAKPVLRKAVRPFVRKGWFYWVRFAALLALASYLGHVMGQSQRYTDLRYAIYQWQVKLQQRGQFYPQHTVLVLLDDDDYWSVQYQGRRPLKRDRLAEIVDRLNGAGAKTVALDIDLRSPLPEIPAYEFPDYRQENEELIGAVQRMCASGRHVVLASSVRFAQAGGFETMPSIYTAGRPTLPCVRTGYIQLPDDMRLVPGALELANGSYMDSFSLAIVKTTDPIAYHHAVDNEDHGFRFSQFLTPADFSPKAGRQFVFDGVAVQRMSDPALRAAVEDKTVIVGGHWHEFAYGTGPFVDTWLSPGGAEPGAMLHANYVEAMLNRSGTFTPISDMAAALLEWGLAFALATIVALDIHALWKWSAFILASVFSILLTYVLLQNLGLFLDFMIPLLMIVVHTIADEVLEMRHQVQHLKHQLKEFHH
jgi:CHASE2 domain-containing sensor protein